MTLRRRLLVIAALLVVALSGLVVAGIGTATARSDAADDDRALTLASEQALRLASGYVDMETGQRGFIIGGDDIFLEPYRSGSAAVDALQSSLKQFGKQWNAMSRASLSQTIAAGDAWRTRAEEEIRIRRTRGRVAAESAVADRTGMERFDRVRAYLQALSSQLGVEQSAASRRREHLADRLSALLVAIPILALGFTILAIGLITLWVTRPIDRVLAAVRSVVAGDLSTAVPSSGAAEIAELGTAVDTMRLTITDRLTESERLREIADRSREAVEQSATVTLQLRNELASELGSFPAGWSAAARLLPAEGLVAGDCYDVTLISPQQLGLIVIDIAGHGARQAIVALRCKEILRAALRMNRSPGAALGLLAEQVGDLHPSFVTAFVGVVDTATGACRYANAGHPPALLADHDDALHELGPTGPLLGVYEAEWKTADAHLEPGAKLVIYTDGLSEARDEGQVFYGTERLAELVVTLPCEVAESVIKSCFDDLHAFRPARLSDDVTMVLLCRECSQ